MAKHSSYAAPYNIFGCAYLCLTMPFSDIPTATKKTLTTSGTASCVAWLEKDN